MVRWVGGLVLKMKLMLTQLSTKLELKLKLKLSLAKGLLNFTFFKHLNQFCFSPLEMSLSMLKIYEIVVENKSVSFNEINLVDQLIINTVKRS